MASQQIIDYFEIPEELAKELSDLLTKQSIRERIASQLVDQPEKYEEAEKLLIPVTRRIEALKIKITKEYIPDQYNSSKYMWNYDGYDVDGNRVQIINA